MKCDRNKSACVRLSAAFKKNMYFGQYDDKNEQFVLIALKFAESNRTVHWAEEECDDDDP